MSADFSKRRLVQAALSGGAGVVSGIAWYFAREAWLLLVVVLSLLVAPALLYEWAVTREHE